MLFFEREPAPAWLRAGARLLRRRQAEMGDDRPRPPRRRTRADRAQTRSRHRNLARAQRRNPHRLRRALVGSPGPGPGQSGRTRLAPSTFAEYRRALRKHVLPRLGARTLASLRTDDIDALIAALEVDGRAPGTVRNVVTPLRKMLADAVRQGKLATNPAMRADLDRKR